MQTDNCSKCCFCNADILNVIRWQVTVLKINTMGVYAQYPNRKQLRNVCNLCMTKIKDAMDKLDDGADSAMREAL